MARLTLPQIRDKYITPEWTSGWKVIQWISKDYGIPYSRAYDGLEAMIDKGLCEVRDEPDGISVEVRYLKDQKNE